MADAMCGPSNPLQNFRKHTSTDRSLQQDRLIARHSPGADFRSASRANTGALDAEFEAFQAGFGSAIPPPLLNQHVPIHFNPAYTTPTPASQSTPPWAIDFQRTRIHTPQSSSTLAPQSHPQGQISEWYQEFQNQLYPAPQQPSRSLPQYQPRFSNYAQHPISSFAAFDQPSVQSRRFESVNEVGRVVQADEQFDAEAFDKAFEDHLAAETQRTRSAYDNDESSTLENLIERMDVLQREGNDRMEQENQARLEKPAQVLEELKTLLQPPGQDEELAKTAGQLLDRVADNNSEKFQRSSFLAMMRQLRDYEIRVDGDKMVETTTTNGMLSPTSDPPAPSAHPFASEGS